MAAPVIESKVCEVWTLTTYSYIRIDPVPTGITTGDLLLVLLMKDGGGTSTTPTGYTSVYGGKVQINSTQMYAYWKIAESADESITELQINHSGNEPSIGMMFRISGHDATTPINVYATDDTGNSAVVVSPTATTTANDCLVFSVGVFDDGGINEWTGAPSGMSLQYARHTSTASPNHVGGLAATITKASAGATGTYSWSSQPRSDYWGSATIAIAPAASAGTLNVDFLSSAAAVYEPTLVPGAAPLTVDFLASAAAVYEPTLVPGAAPLTVDFLPSAAAIYEPTFVPGAAPLTVDFLASGAAIYEPTLAAPVTAITVDFLASSAAVYEPTLVPGAAPLTVDFIASTATIYEPTLAAVYTPVDDTYTAGASETIYFGMVDPDPGTDPGPNPQFTVTFYDDQDATFNLNTQFGSDVVISTPDTLPTNVTLRGLDARLDWVHIAGTDNTTVTMTANPSVPKFMVESTVHAAGTLIPTTVGCVFPKGAVWTNDEIGTTNGQYAVVKRRWNDGSVKHVKAMGVFPVGTEVRLSDVTPSGTDLTEADIVAAAPTASFDLTVGGIAYSNTLTSVLGVPHSVKESNPSMVEAWYRTQFGGTSVEGWFQVRLFAGGEMWIRCWASRPYMIRGSRIGSSVNISGTVTIFGDTIDVTTGVNLYPNQKFKFGSSGNTWSDTGLHQWERFSGTQYNFNMWHDTDQIQSSRLTPNYGRITSTKSSVLAALKAEAYLGEACELSKVMYAPGFNPGHAPLSGHVINFLKSDADPRAWKSVFNNDDAAGHFCVEWRTDDGNIMGPSDNPLGGYSDLSTSVGLATEGYVNNNWYHDDAHNPGFGYMSYLISGDDYYKDIMTGNVASFYQAIPSGDGDGLLRIGRRQVRGTGWLYKTLTQACAILPDGDPLLDDLQSWLRNNTNYWANKTINHPAVGSSAGLGISYIQNDHQPTVAGTQHAPFETSYWHMSLGMAVDIEPSPVSDMTVLDNLYAWNTRFITGLFGGDTGFCYTYAASYDMVVSANDGVDYGDFYASDTTGIVFFQTWAEVWAEMYPTDPACGSAIKESGLWGSSTIDLSNGYNYYCVHWANLQYAVQHGKPTQAIADASLTRIINASNASDLFSGLNSAVTAYSMSPYALDPHTDLVTQVKDAKIEFEAGTIVIPPVITEACSQPGIPIPVPDISGSYVWTPTMSGGVVRCASVEALPSWTWVEVSPSVLNAQQIEDLHSAAGWDWNTNVVGNSATGIGTLSANTYSGCAHDLSNNKIWLPWVGGHVASSYNACFGLDLPSFNWILGGIPNTGADPSGPNPWCDNYRNLATGVTNTYSTYPYQPSQGCIPPYPEEGNILPGYFPTSMHHYSGLWIDPNRQTINAFRERHFELGLPGGARAGQWKDHFWNEGGVLQKPTIYGQFYWNEIQGEAFGSGKIDTYDNLGHLFEIDPSVQPEDGSWSYTTKGTGMRMTINIHSCRADRPNGNSYIYFFNNSSVAEGNVDQFFWYNLSSKAYPAPTPINNPLSYTDMLSGPGGGEGIACVYLPPVDKILRKIPKSSIDPAQGWSLYNITTNTNETYVPEGNVPDREMRIFNRMFWYEPWQCVVAVHGKYGAYTNSSPCMWVMRVD